MRTSKCDTNGGAIYVATYGKDSDGLSTTTAITMNVTKRKKKIETTNQKLLTTLVSHLFDQH